MTVELAGTSERTEFGVKLRLYLMMFLQYFVQGAYLPVISEYLQSALDFDASQIGWFSAALAFGPLVTPFVIGQLVDRHFATQHVLAFCHLTSGVLMLALYNQTEFWPVMALGTLYSTLYTPTMMLTNSLTFQHLKNRDREFPAIRLWGTIGFIVPAWFVEMYLLRGITGAEVDTARGIVLVVSGVGSLLLGVYCLTLPDTPPHRSDTPDLAPAKVLGLLRERGFLVLVLVSFLVAIVHQFYFVWNSPYLRTILTSGGRDPGAWEQRIASLGQVFEVVVMIGLGFAVQRFGFKWTMLIGALAYMLRCLVFAFAVAVDAPFPVVMTLVCLGQMLHGFCFGCFLATAFMYVDRVSPPDVRGTTQTFYGTFVLSLGFIAGGFISGAIGSLFTQPLGTQMLRDKWGIATDAGLKVFTQQGTQGPVELVRDWPGVWLACAALAAVALILFALLFPKQSREHPAESLGSK
jgi:nucleoside transporter